MSAATQGVSLLEDAWQDRMGMKRAHPRKRIFPHTRGGKTWLSMRIPAGGGPIPHRHDFEESFTILEGEIEATFRGATAVFTE